MLGYVNAFREKASFCVLVPLLGFYLHLFLCLNLPYFLASSLMYSFEKIKKIHYLQLFSREDQKGT